MMEELRVAVAVAVTWVRRRLGPVDSTTDHFPPMVGNVIPRNAGQRLVRRSDAVVKEIEDLERELSRRGIIPPPH